MTAIFSIGLLYIFMAFALYVIGRKKSIFDKINRPSSYASSRTKKDAKGSRKIDEWLKKQNLGLHAREFLVLLLIIGTLPILIGFLFRLHLVLCLGLSMAGVSFFFIWIRFKNKKDNAKKEEQMEQFLLDLTANLYSNPNVINCIIKAAQQIDNPLKREFASRSFRWLDMVGCESPITSFISHTHKLCLSQRSITILSLPLSERAFKILVMFFKSFMVTL